MVHLIDLSEKKNPPRQLETVQSSREILTSRYDQIQSSSVRCSGIEGAAVQLYNSMSFRIATL